MELRFRYGAGCCACGTCGQSERKFLRQDAAAGRSDPAAGLACAVAVLDAAMEQPKQIHGNPLDI